MDSKKIKDAVVDTEIASEEVQVVEEKTSEAPSSELENTLIYIGPVVNKYHLLPHQVFMGGIPEYLQDLFAQAPYVKSLFVPVDTFATAIKEVTTKGTALHTLYEKTKEVN